MMNGGEKSSMTIHQCDICRSTLEDKFTVSVGFGRSFSPCPACGYPVIDFLKELGLLDQDVISEFERRQRVLQVNFENYE
jgi:hypothetical protein